MTENLQHTSNIVYAFGASQCRGISPRPRILVAGGPEQIAQKVAGHLKEHRFDVVRDASEDWFHTEGLGNFSQSGPRFDALVILDTSQGVRDKIQHTVNSLMQLAYSLPTVIVTGHKNMQEVLDSYQQVMTAPVEAHYKESEAENARGLILEPDDLNQLEGQLRGVLARQAAIERQFRSA